MDHRYLFDKVGNYRNRQGVDAGEVHSSRQIEVTISRLHFQARQVRPGEQGLGNTLPLIWMGEALQGCLRSLLVGRHQQQKWWLLSRSWGPSSMKPGAISIHRKEAYGGS